MIQGLRRLLSSAAIIRWNHGIPLRIQRREFRRFRDAIGMDRAEFMGYGLWDVTRPLAERMTMMSNVERRAIEYRMNPREPNLRIRNKAWTTAVLEDAGIAVGRVLCLLTVRNGIVPSTDRFTFRQGDNGVRLLLANVPADGIVIKPDDGGSGRSVYVFRRATPNGLEALDGTRWTVNRFRAVLATEGLWKVEQRIPQHPQLVRIAGETLGTLRLTTFRMLDGTVHMAPSVWKIPIGLSGVDHFSHGVGQLAAPVDPVEGRIGPARRWFGLERVDRHPLTGTAITGTVIPHWPAARVMAHRIADCFPELASLAYDVAITDTGPVVIEVNPCWGERTIQAPWRQGLVQGEFREFLEERGYGDVVNLSARNQADSLFAPGG